MAGADTSERPPPREHWPVLLAVGALGVSCVMTQLALMRELLGVFSGNELILGILLAHWLLLTGLGTWLGKWAHGKSALGRMVVLQILIALLPLGQVLMVRLLRDAVFGHGVTIGIMETGVSSFVVLLPFCVVSGVYLTLACQTLAERGTPGAVSRVYVADSLGSVAGGLLFSFWLVHYCDHLAILTVAAVLSLVAALGVALAARRKVTAMAAGACLVAVALAALFGDMDTWSTARQYPEQHLRFQGSSPYGKLVVTEAGGQINFLYNGQPVLSSHNREQVEETVHYAMAQRPDAQRVLLVGGASSGTAREILRYGVREVVAVELDPLILQAGRTFFRENLADERIRVVAADGRRFIQTNTQPFEVVILDVPDPSPSQLNRFYTAEFFAEVNRGLTSNGVLALALGRYENFVSPHLARMLSTASRTLHTSFDHVLMIPGGRVFFVASDGVLTTDIAGRMAARGIQGRLVNRHYLEATLAPDRLADLERATAQAADLNRDFNPVLYFHSVAHWMSQFPIKLGWMGGALVLTLLGYLFTLRTAGWVVFASGFAASALEVVLLLGYQVLYGSLYQQMGIIVTLFMAGLAAGAHWANRHMRTLNRRHLAGLAMAIMVLAALLPLVLPALGHAARHAGLAWIGQFSIPALTFLLAALVGAEFPLANHLESPGAAAAVSRLYTADFVGACLGALLASTLLIPLLGVTATCLLTAGLNLLGGAALFFKKG